MIVEPCDSSVCRIRLMKALAHETTKASAAAKLRLAPRQQAEAVVNRLQVLHPEAPHKAECHLKR